MKLSQFDPLIEKIKMLAEKIDVLSQRERVMVFIGVVFLFSLAWVNLFFMPHQLARKSLIAQEITAAQGLQDLKTHLDSLTPEMLSKKLVQVTQERVIKVEEFKKINDVLNDRNSHIVDTDKINRDVLQTILDGFKKLRLMNMEKTDNAPINNSSVSQLGVKLTLKGDYLTFLDFLSELEESHWQLFWASLSYTVTNYPEATIVLDIAIPNVSNPGVAA
jgi:MSHA biogenesis protein MshJ